MAKNLRATRKRLANCVGKTRLSELTQDEIDHLWSERICRDCDHAVEELRELEKSTAERLRVRIVGVLRTKANRWDRVTLQMLEGFPREGLSDCENAVLDGLIERKRRGDRKTITPDRTDAVGSCNVEGAEESPVRDAYHGSDAVKSKRLYRRLEEKGRDGELAAQLLRSQKASSRAKQYRRDYKDYAYSKKGEGLARLCELLGQSDHRWGWGLDPSQEDAPYVLYVDLPNGQISFHAVNRGEGPEYSGDWDREHASEARIIRFAESILSES